MTGFKKIFGSKLIANSFIYVISEGINKSIPFILLPFLSYYLLPPDYGILTNFNVLIQILSVFCFSSTAAALPVMFYKLNKRNLRLYVSNMIFLNTFVTIIMLIILVFLYKSIYEKLQLSFYFQFIALSVVWFTSLTNINMILWRCEEKPIMFGAYQISQSLVNGFLAVLLVIILLQGWSGRIYSYLISSVIFGFISIYILFKRHHFIFSISKEYLKHVIFFALPLIPHALSFWLKSGMDKILLTDMCGLSENGLYSVSMTMGAIVTLVLLAFNNAYLPHLFKKLNYIENSSDISIISHEKKQLVKITYLIIGSIGFLVLFSYCISWLIIKYVYNELYIDSLKFLPYIMISQFFYGCYLMYVGYFYHTFKTKLLGIITFTLSLIQVALSFILIKWLGSLGVAVASVIGSVLTFIIICGFSMKIYKLPWKLN